MCKHQAKNLITGILIYPIMSLTMAAAYFDRIFLYSYNDVVAFFYMFFNAYYSMTDKILVDDKIFVLKS